VKFRGSRTQPPARAAATARSPTHRRSKATQQTRARLSESAAHRCRRLQSPRTAGSVQVQSDSALLDRALRRQSSSSNGTDHRCPQRVTRVWASRVLAGRLPEEAVPKATAMRLQQQAQAKKEGSRRAPAAQAQAARSIGAPLGPGRPPPPTQQGRAIWVPAPLQGINEQKPRPTPRAPESGPSARDQGNSQSTGPAWRQPQPLSERTGKARVSRGTTPALARQTEGDAGPPKSAQGACLLRGDVTAPATQSDRNNRCLRHSTTPWWAGTALSPTLEEPRGGGGGGGGGGGEREKERGAGEREREGGGGGSAPVCGTRVPGREVTTNPSTCGSFSRKTSCGAGPGQ